MSSIIKGLGGWLKNSFIDFPGTVSTVLFFNRCNLKCPYCHNPNFTDGTISLEEYSNEIWDFLKKRKNVIKGVVLSGGEPTLFDNIVELTSKIRELGYKVKLDTNGLRPDVIQAISPDYIALDIKSVFENYSKYLNSSQKNIDECLSKSIEYVKKMEEQAEIRITAAPKIINKDLIEELSKNLKGVKKIYLQKFSYGNHIMNKDFFKNTEEKDIHSELESIRTVLLQSCEYCEIR